MIGSWQDLNSEGGVHLVYSLPGTVRVIKSRRMGWARHVADMGAIRMTYRT
jgi:hypothetical protein